MRKKQKKQRLKSRMPEMCIHCFKRTVVDFIVEGHKTIRVRNGKKHQITVPKVPVKKCFTCGKLRFTQASEIAIQESLSEYLEKENDNERRTTKPQRRGHRRSDKKAN